VNASQHIGHLTGSNHECTLSEHTAVAHIANWLHLEAGYFSTYAICSSIATRLLDTWKNSTAVKESQCSGHRHSTFRCIQHHDVK